MKKLNIGNNKVSDKIKIWKLLIVIVERLFFERNPPDDTIVKAKLNESKSLIFAKLYKKITKMVVKEYISKTLKELELKSL